MISDSNFSQPYSAPCGPVRAAAFWRHRRGALDLAERPLVMGILNVTPDSFWDGGQHATLKQAVAHGLAMQANGADIIDVGGESTRPGSEGVDAAEEAKRVLPVIHALREATDIPLSIDTMKADVASQALEAGADIVNDVSACTGDPAMARVIIESGAGAILMHMRGTPRDMQKAPTYNDVANEVTETLLTRAEALRDAGAEPERLALDPGIGFGKNADHNLRLMAKLDRLTGTGYPVVLGISRKSIIGVLTGRAPHERLAGSLAAIACAVRLGVRIVRVHDVRESRDAIAVATALERASHELA